MLWSLLKFVLFIALVVGAVFGAEYLLGMQETDLSLRLILAGQERTITPLDLVLVFAALTAVLWVLLKLVGLLLAVWHFLAGDETAISRYFDRSREKRGFHALTDAITALAAGEPKKALSAITKAERYLRDPALTDLVRAQAAEAAGDRKLAEVTYKRLISHDKTRFVGIRGAMKARLAAGDEDTAMQLAERALALRPKHEEVQDTLLQLQAAKGDFEGARKTLAAKLKSGTLPRDVYKRRDAVLALSTAQGIFEDGASLAARERAIEANRLSPDLIPAAVMAARSYVEQGNKKSAARLLAKTWSVQPHPDLAQAFAAIEPEEDAQARLKRFAALTKHHVDHPETRMLRAELEIASENFPEARRAMGALAEEKTTTRSATIMAAIARGEGLGDALVRGWLARAVTAPRGPQWICDNCQTIAASWEPVCQNCHGFDTLSWRDAPAQEIKLPGGTEMLPLLVGADKPTDLPATMPDEDTAQGDVIDAESKSA